MKGVTEQQILAMAPNTAAAAKSVKTRRKKARTQLEGLELTKQPGEF